MNGYDPEWYRSFFGQDYLDVYGHLLTEESSDAEARLCDPGSGPKAG